MYRDAPYGYKQISTITGKSLEEIDKIRGKTVDKYISVLDEIYDLYVLDDEDLKNHRKYTIKGFTKEQIAFMSELFHLEGEKFYVFLNKHFDFTLPRGRKNLCIS